MLTFPQPPDFRSPLLTSLKSRPIDTSIKQGTVTNFRKREISSALFHQITWQAYADATQLQTLVDFYAEVKTSTEFYWYHPKWLRTITVIFEEPYSEDGSPKTDLTLLSFNFLER